MSFRNRSIYNNTDLDVWKRYNGNKRFFRIEVWPNILYEDARNDLEILNNFIDQKKNGNVTFRNVSYAYDFEDELVDEDAKISTLCGTIAENGDFIFDDNVYQGGEQKKSNFVIKEFGELAYNLEDIERIDIPNSVTEIRFNSFVECGLREINLPDSLKSIDMWAFYECNNLEEIKIPNSVEFLHSNAFEYCSSLNNIELPASIGSISKDLLPNDTCTVTVANWQMGSLLYLQGISTNRIFIKNAAPTARYDWWPIDGNLIVPGECTSIRNQMFIDRVDLLNIKIQNGVQHIGSDSFAKCSNLLTVMIPDSIVSIGDAAFDQCTNLQYIQINLSQDNLRLNEYLRIYNMLAKSGVDMNRTHVGTNVAFKQLKK